MKQITEKTKVREPLILLLSKVEFSLLERRIYWIVLSQMEQGFNVSQDLFQNLEFKIPISELKETNRQRFIDLQKKIPSRIVSKSDYTNDSFKSFVPFPLAHYDGKNGFFELTMFAEAVPHFMELKKGYSEFEIMAALSLTSEYSQRLYPLLSSWKDKGKWLNVDVEHLKELLGASHYTSFGNFKQRVLDVAQKEMREKTNIYFDMVFHKIGRNITTIDFIIYRMDEIEAIEAHKAVKAEMDSVEKLDIGRIMVQASQILSSYNFSSKQYQAIMSNPKILQLFIEEDSKITHGVRKNIHNKTAYMATILGFSNKKS